jgi:hypothetical protein
MLYEKILKFKMGKNLHIITKIIIFFLIILDLILLLQFYIIRNDNINLKSSLQVSTVSNKKLENRIDNVLLNFSLMFEFQSVNIDRNAIFYDENDNKITLDQIIRKSPYLIFKYSALNCDVCVEEQISLLKGAMKLHGLNNILIITNYNSYTDLIKFKRMNQIDVEILNMKNTEFTPIDKSLPYYFILDESCS